MTVSAASYRGALLGLAVGDAVGTTLEFTRPGEFEPIDDMVGGGPFLLEPGQWTDDTSMALCLAESLIEKGGFDARDQMERYVRWWRTGYMSVTGYCFDIGTTTVMALNRFEESGDPWSGGNDERAAGNGSLMRLAPVPLRYAYNLEEAIEMSAQSSRTTHSAKVCVDVCRYFGALVAGASAGASKEELLDDGFWRFGELHPEVEEIAQGSYKHREPPEITGSGYVVRTLEAALWALYRTETFAEGCLKVVNLGQDADTTGAVYGQIAGALYGESGIPVTWRERVAWADVILARADQLYEDAQRGVGP